MVSKGHRHRVCCFQNNHRVDRFFPLEVHLWKKRQCIVTSSSFWLRWHLISDRKNRMNQWWCTCWVSHLSMAWYSESFISIIGLRWLSFLGNLRRPCTILRPIIDSIYPYNRYLDNDFIICNEDNYVNNILDEFSNYPQPVRLKMKLEYDSGFHFLDVLVKKKSDGSLQRSWYGKPRWNGQYTNFQSRVQLI